MTKMACIYLVVAGMLYFVQGQIQIKTELLNGNLKFTWNGNKEVSYIKIKLGTGAESDWIAAQDKQYTVKDVLKYPNVTITVDEYQPYPTKTYHVPRIDVHEGESKNLTWTADFFPRGGDYSIFHYDEGTSNRIMSVMRSGATTTKPLKYVYHTRPYNSTNIILEVKNITLMDGGYYGGGGTQTDARSGQGVILVVRGKPTEPQIKGTMETTENSDVTLTCSSNSTSRPSYYSKTISLTYIWYRNNTVINSETRKTLRIPRISKDVRFNKYRCQSKETVESEKSVGIQINVLYGPSSCIIRPSLPVNQLLSVKNGDYIGPYHCSADCNPPCSIQWKYKLSNGTFREADSDVGKLLQQRVFKDKVLFQCVAKSTSGYKAILDITLQILYLSEPRWNVNGKIKEFVDVNEGEPLILTCRVEAKPTPNLSISNSSEINILESQVSNAVNISIPEVQCSDTDIYRCTGSLAGFVSKQKEVSIGVLCKVRIDAKPWFKVNYGVKSGIGVKLTISAPIISYPKPSASLISWSAPTSTRIESEIRERGNVVYKHWVINTIPVNDQRYFGNYTMAYAGEAVFTITIKDEGIPTPPLNFTGYSYSSGYVNLTWISDFNGGPEQFFILSRKDKSGWIEVANITDPGEGDMGYYDPGLLNPGREYRYRLESCNGINCSSRPAEVEVTVLECNSRYFLSSKNPDLHYRNNSDCWPCGNCRDNLPCNMTTGHCSEGCHINFQPPYCTELITPDQSNTLQTTTIVLAIVCTVLLVTLAIIAGVAFRRRLKRRLESKPSQSENEVNAPMNATEEQQQPEDTYDYPLNEYEKINAGTNDHTSTTQEQPQPDDTYECPLNEYKKINVATDDHACTTPEISQPEGTDEYPLNEYEKINTTIDVHTYDKVA